MASGQLVCKPYAKALVANCRTPLCGELPFPEEPCLSSPKMDLYAAEIYRLQEKHDHVPLSVLADRMEVAAHFP